MDSHSGRVGSFADIRDFILKDGRDPARDMIEVAGSPEAVERVSKAVAAHRPNRKARRKAQRAARRKNRAR